MSTDRREFLEPSMVATFVASPQQATVLSWVKDGTGSAFIEAVAGAGKTTTLVEALKLTTGYVAFAAFNKKIADEIKLKVEALNLGNRITVGTFHSFGLKAWRKAYPRVQVDERKKLNQTLDFFRSRKSPEALDGFVLKLVSLAKQRAIGLGGNVADKSAWYEIVDHFDLSYELDETDCTIEQGVDLAIETLQLHTRMAPELINFDDMIYMPVVSGVKVWQNDWVFIDEAQDTNPARRALARKLLLPRGRSAWVGDRHQGIFGFTGADADAIDKIIEEFSCQTLPLTVTFRCPKAVVEEARKTVSHIEAHTTAPDGEVTSAQLLDLLKKPEELRADDAVLCRLTKPLVSLAYQLIRRGVACHVEGREIGAGLVKLINRFRRARDLAGLRDLLEAYGETESQKLVAKGKETAAEALMDRIETIFVIMDAAPPATDVAELRRRIETMFTDSNGAKPTLTLSTVHKAKGREWERVFILDKARHMPSKWARQAWQLEQEHNLIYVAVTRAKSKLVMLNSGGEVQ